MNEEKYWLLLTTENGTWLGFKPVTLEEARGLRASSPKAHWGLYEGLLGPVEVEEYFRGQGVRPTRGWYKLAGGDYDWFVPKVGFVGSVEMLT